MTDQYEALVKAEEVLGLGPVAMAQEMGTPYSTYKKWRGGQNRMPAVGWRCLELLLGLKKMERMLDKGR